MTVECNCGLFAGVSEYPRLRKDRWLPGAVNGAEHLRQYFQSANPAGYWRALLGNVERLDLIEEIDDLCHRVPAGEAGVVYFSGHAMQAGNGGLLLACSDFRGRHPLDSSLHLRRVFELLRGRPGRFAIILDTCRERSRDAPPDDIPENVAVFYACRPGESTFENSAGGVLTRALLAALASLGTGLPNWSLRPLRVLAEQVREASIEMNHPAVPLPELCGSHDAINVRVQAQPDRTTHPKNKKEQPSCIIRTMTFPNTKSLNRFACVLVRDLERWLECGMKMPVTAGWADDFRIAVNSSNLDLHIPRHQQLASQLVSLLVSRYSERLEYIRFEWPYETNVDAFLGLGPLLGDATRLNRAWRPKKGQFTWEQVVIKPNEHRTVRAKISGRLEVKSAKESTVAEIRAASEKSIIKPIAGLASVVIAISERLLYSRLSRQENEDDLQS